MNAPSPLTLSVFYWLHMLATVVWIGGVASSAVLWLPVARRVLTPEQYAQLLLKIQRRLDPLSWASLVLLLGTGLFQMSANPNYAGFLAINNRWAVAILVKHILFLAMGGISALMTWGILPAMGRAALRLQGGKGVTEFSRLARREALLVRLNLVFGVLVLLLTALARTA